MDKPPLNPPATESGTVPESPPAPEATLTRLSSATGAVAPQATAVPGIPPELADHPRYRVTALVGQGGMGAVYKAEHRRMERTVALKVVNPALINHPSAVQRFQQEVRAAAKLHHPNIVTAFDADQAGDLHFLVMEFVEGQSLSDYLEQKGPLPPVEACEYTRQAALGLQHAYEQGMVHRDVKPHNLMRTPQGEIKILDFGLARLGLAPELADSTAPAAAAAGTSGTDLTAVGAVMGTADYISPEQASDSHKADIRADIYSLGCTLYHLLTGQAPFAGGSALEKVVRHAVEAPATPRKLRRDLAVGLAAVVLKMMAKDPAARYQTPAEAAQALAPFATPPKRRLPLLLAGAASAVVVAAAALYVVFFPPHKAGSPPPTSPAAPDPVEMAGRPDAADGLRREDIPTAALTWAGQGDPAQAPPELVAVLGDGRFRFYGQPGVPAFNPRGDVLALPSGWDVLLFDADSGQCLRTLSGHLNRVYRVAFSRDGKTIATGSLDHVVKVWDAATGHEKASFADACGAYAALDFLGPDGATLLVGAEDGGIRRFDVAAGKETSPPLQGGPPDVCCLTVRPDGKALATASRDGTVCIWDLVGGVVKQRFNLSQKAADENAVVAYSPDGSLLAAGNETEVKVWDASLAERWSAKTAGAGLTAFAGDGQTLVTAGRDRRPDRPYAVQRWRVADGADLGAVAPEGKGGVVMCALKPDGKTLAFTINTRQVLRLYDIDTGRSRFPETGHVGAVHALAFLPGGKTLVSGGEDGLIVVWDLATGAELLTLTGHTDAVKALAFAPDGQTLASGGADGSVRLWDVNGWQPLHVLSGHPGGVEDLAYSPDGRTLASCGKDHAVRLWDPTDGARKGKDLVAPAGVNGVAFRPDGRGLASVGDDQAVTLWDVDTGRKGPPCPGGEVLRKAVFFPNDGTLATIGDDGQLRLRDPATGAARGELFRSGFELTKLAVRPDGGMVAATGAGGAVRLWDPAADSTRREVFFLGPIHYRADAVAFSPEGRYLAAAGPDGTVCLFRLAPRGVIAELPIDATLAEERLLAGHAQNAVHSAAFEADGRHVLTCCPDNQVRRWDLDNPTAAEVFKGCPKNVGAVAFLPDGKRLLSGGRDGRARLWDFKAGKEVDFKETHTGDIAAVGLSADGRFALTGGVDRTARLWDASTGQLLKAFQGHEGEVRCVALSADEGRLAIATGSADGTVRLWDRTSDRPLHVFTGYQGKQAGLCVSRDGKRLAWGGDDGLIHIWDLLACEELRRLPFHDGLVRGLAFSPDGRRLLAAGDGGLLSLWEVETGRVVDRTRSKPAWSVAFSPDGRRAAIGCDDAAARVWRLP